MQNPFADHEPVYILLKSGQNFHLGKYPASSFERESESSKGIWQRKKASTILASYFSPP